MGNVTRAAVKAREEETFESLLRRFKKQVNKYGIILEYKKKTYYVSPSEEKHATRLKRIKKIKKQKMKEEKLKYAHPSKRKRSR